MNRTTHRVRRARGFTLIELLIAISLMLVLTLILTQIFDATADVFSRAQQQVQIYANQKSFVELLQRELSNMLPSSDDPVNSLRIYSPTDLGRDSTVLDGGSADPPTPEPFPFASGPIARYEDSYFNFDDQYGGGTWTKPYPDEVDLSGGRIGAYDAEEENTEYSPPLLCFATTTTYVAEGERIVAPAWVEYYMAKTTVVIEGQQRLYLYLKRRLMRPQAFLSGSSLYYPDHPYSTDPVSSAQKAPFEERPWREELYEGSFHGDTVLEFFPRVVDVSTEFKDTTDVLRIEFLVHDASAENGKGAFAWIRPDERFGEAVFLVAPPNPLCNGDEISPDRPPRSYKTSGPDANFYPSDLLSQTNPNPEEGGMLSYASQTPLAIRLTALLGHDRSSTTAKAREDYTSDPVPPRTFQHVFWLPTAPADLEKNP